MTGQDVRIEILRFGLGACLMVVLTGCGGSSGPDLLPAEGTVTLDGQPLDQAVVTFVPANGRPSVGVTDPQGHYRLKYTEDRSGALPGAHKVVIVSEVAPSGGEGSDPKPGRKELLPKRYHEQTELTANVVSGTKTYDFQLQSKP